MHDLKYKTVPIKLTAILDVFFEPCPINSEHLSHSTTPPPIYIYIFIICDIHIIQNYVGI